ncbi:MAG: TlpA family protein disulfide reductase [Acidobacteriaceae bacterium]
MARDLTRRLAVVVLLIAGVTLIMLAGAHNLRTRQTAVQSQQEQMNLTSAASSSAASGAAADSGDDSTDKPMLGKSAPDFTLVDLNGKKISLSDYKGHAVVLNFWATYCSPCKLEMPWFQDLENRYQSEGLVVLGVDQDDGMAPKDVAAAARKIGVTYPILIPNGEISTSYQLGDYIPQTFYINKRGMIVDQTVGAHSRDEMEADIEKAMGAGGE